MDFDFTLFVQTFLCSSSKQMKLKSLLVQQTIQAQMGKNIQDVLRGICQGIGYWKAFAFRTSSIILNRKYHTDRTNTSSVRTLSA